MKNMLVALFVISLAATAFAYPGPDSIGIYVDGESATPDRSLQTTVPYEEVTTYLCITNPSGGGVSGWECMVTIEGSTMLAPVWNLTAGLDVDDRPDHFQVGIGVTPDALDPNAHGVVVLASWTALITDTTTPIYFKVDGVPESTSFTSPTSPGYAAADDAGDLIRSWPCTGDPNLAVFAINDPAFIVIGNDDMSFSDIKNLYR